MPRRSALCVHHLSEAGGAPPPRGATLTPVIVVNEGSALRCAVCGEEHPRDGSQAGACDALRAAGALGARPPGVPIRIQGAYVEAREALRADAPLLAIETLQWLLSHLAETRGVNPELSLPAKVSALADAGIIAMAVRSELLAPAASADARPETAWGLMTLAEHALARVYLRPRSVE